MWSRLLILSVYIAVLFFFGECANTNDGIAVRALPMIYTTECQSVTGKWCLNDCVDGRCSVDIDVVENCHRCHSPAPTYFTTGQEYTDQFKCTSRCTKLSGDERPRCYVDYDWNKLDFCNPDFTKSFEYRDFTVANGPCANDCRPKSTSIVTYARGDCNDISGTLRECYIDKYLYETVRTLSGHTCNGQCLRHDGTSYNWCYYDASNWDYCARPAIYKTACHNCSSIHLRQDETVSKYAERMERDPRYRTVLVNNPNNPIYSYTYNETMTPQGSVRLPLVIRARVSRSHIQPSNSRGSNAISSDSRTNCRRMGMTGTDAVGHLIAWKLGGPSDFYNFVPMTRAINIGSVSGGSVYAPSVWAATERENAELVEREDGQVSIVAVLRYNPNDPRFPYRPYRIGWGQWARAANGDGVLSCTNYWYNNEFDAEDPDCL